MTSESSFAAGSMSPFRGDGVDNKLNDSSEVIDRISLSYLRSKAILNKIKVIVNTFTSISFVTSKK